MLEFEDDDLEDEPVAKGKTKKQQPEDNSVYEEAPKKPSKQKECDYISEFVSEKVGYRRETTRVVTHHLWDNFYRCNVWAKESNRNFISHSFFLSLNGEQVVGQITKERYVCSI